MPEPSRHRVLLGSSLDLLAGLESGSIDLAVTSPPYWRIKDYGIEGQIGSDQSYAEYLDSLGAVWSECHRLLRPGCRIAINIGDQYLRASEYGRYRVQPIPADTIRACMETGFDYMGSIIWRKISTTNTTGGGAWMGSVYHPKDGHITYEHEYILLFRKRGDWTRRGGEVKEKSRLTKEQRSEWFRGYWELAPERQDDHLAKFPLELPGRLIRMYSFFGETVLDPFLGSGTTTLAAKRYGRDSIGVELNREFLPVIMRKLGVRSDLFGQSSEQDDGFTHRDGDAEISFEGAPRPPAARPSRAVDTSGGGTRS